MPGTVRQQINQAPFCGGAINEFDQKNISFFTPFTQLCLPPPSYEDEYYVYLFLTHSVSVSKVFLGERITFSKCLQSVLLNIIIFVKFIMSIHRDL